MRGHLKHKHPSVNLDLSQKPEERRSEPRQTTLNFSTSRPLSSSTQEELNRKLALMCALDMRPISIVEGVGFKNFVSALNPNYKIPCRKTVMKHLHILYEECKKDLIELLMGVDSVAFTSDLWTSTALNGYITVTAQYLDNKWEMRPNVLATRVMGERHTGTNIGTQISKIKDEFRIKKCSALLTDNASNMGTAAKELGFAHVHCFAHTLQLAVEDGLKVSQIAKTLGAARRIVTHFNHSVFATDALLAKQPENQKLKLIPDVPTRWNSSYYMIERLLKLRIPVYSVIFDEAITKSSIRATLDLKDEYWKVMEDITPILEPLVYATDLLGKESQPTGSGVYVLVHKLMTTGLKTLDGDSGTVKDMKKRITDGLKKRFKVDSDGKPDEEVVTSPLMLSTILDPRYKCLIGREILTQEKVSLLHGTILKLLNETEAPISIASASNVQIKQEVTDECSTLAKKQKVWDFLKGDVIDLSNDETSDTPEEELKAFLSEPVRVSDPLKWWQLNEMKFPRLSKLAKQYLSVPATSIPSERTFSAAGLLVNKLRASLDTETVDQIVFLNKNCKKNVKEKLRASENTFEMSDTTNIYQSNVPVSKISEESSSTKTPPLPALPTSDVKIEHNA